MTRAVSVIAKKGIHRHLARSPSRLERSVAQQNTVKRNESNQDDKNRYREGDGPRTPRTAPPNLAQKHPVLPGCGGQCQSAQAYEGQSQIARRLRTLDVTGGNFFGQVLKELVDAETEPDH